MVGLDHKGAVNVHLVRLGVHGGAQQYYELFVFYLLSKRVSSAVLASPWLKISRRNLSEARRGSLVWVSR